MFSASPISLTEVHTPASSSLCHRHARASALISVPSGCGLELRTIALPAMAKGQKRSNREPKEPKADKKKILASAVPVPSAPAKPKPGATTAGSKK
jgi:hypothetical protein